MGAFHEEAGLASARVVAEALSRQGSITELCFVVAQSYMVASAVAELGDGAPAVELGELELADDEPAFPHEAAFADDPNPHAFNEAFEKAATAAWEEAVARVMALLGEPSLQRALGAAKRRSPACGAPSSTPTASANSACSDPVPFLETPRHTRGRRRGWHTRYRRGRGLFRYAWRCWGATR